MNYRFILILIVAHFILYSVAQASDLILENNTMKVVFNSESGAIEQFTSKLTQWQYQLSYFRIDLDHVPIHRYIAPYQQMMIAVCGYNDRNLIKLALMYQYIISYEPRNFKGRLSEFPMTLAYGKKIDSLRRKYRNFLWDGEFRDTVGAKVFVDGNLYDKYALFTDNSTGKRAVVISNLDYKKSIKVTIELKNHRQLFCATPENPEALPFESSGTIMPNSAMVIFERKL